MEALRKEAVEEASKLKTDEEKIQKFPNLFYWEY